MLHTWLDFKFHWQLVASEISQQLVISDLHHTSHLTDSILMKGDRLRAFGSKHEATRRVFHCAKCARENFLAFSSFPSRSLWFPDRLPSCCPSQRVDCAQSTALGARCATFSTTRGRWQASVNASPRLRRVCSVTLNAHIAPPTAPEMARHSQPEYEPVCAADIRPNAPAQQRRSRGVYTSPNRLK